MARASLLLPSLLVHAVVILAALFPHPCVAAAQSHAANISAVEAAVRDRALELLHAGASKLVDVPLPASLSGAGVVEASALRVRSNALWADGANATAGADVAFAIPPRVLPAPFARRVAIVFVGFASAAGGGDDGDATAAGAAALFAAPPGYALAAPVAGILAYDASASGHDAARVISLRALGAPVRVEFTNLSAAAKGFEFNSTTARCVTFAAGGEVAATHAVASGAACLVTGTGHFGIAVRVDEKPAAATAAVRARWWAWTVGVGAGGVLGASGLAVSVAGAVSWSRRRRREEMERRAMAGEELGRMTVRGSRMPSAKVMRTRPEMEESMGL
ncbi:unnamed protein product [Urochloa decumbens]|uniref:Uncharacterized protein n=1 Tax=Urochloa decumbens TaxID=240449 RepID=A0ABC9E586_9POAL